MNHGRGVNAETAHSIRIVSSLLVTPPRPYPSHEPESSCSELDADRAWKLLRVDEPGKLPGLAQLGRLLIVPSRCPGQEAPCHSLQDHLVAK